MKARQGAALLGDHRQFRFDVFLAGAKQGAWEALLANCGRDPGAAS
jgi:hypothetical protein